MFKVGDKVRPDVSTQTKFDDWHGYSGIKDKKTFEGIVLEISEIRVNPISKKYTLFFKNEFIFSGITVEYFTFVTPITEQDLM